MTIFTLTELLKFLLDFRPKFIPFHDVVGILEDENLSPKLKHERVTSLLKFYGLNSLSQDEDLDFFTEPKMFKRAINPIQLFDIHFDNGKIDFWQNLN